ncbi:hypothetical protein IAD21_06391 (plasmid) [Abditibacteriota bacterium]|nr:hypothetical protein IAD21_06391 [Abditibacteriota bacterium]
MFESKEEQYELDRVAGPCHTEATECGNDDGVVTGIQVVETEVVKLVVIEEHIKTRKEIPYALAYRIRVDKQLIDVPQAQITGAEILKLAGKSPTTTKLYQHKPGQQPQRVKPTDVVDLRCHGIERFTTMANDSTEGCGLGQELC